MIANNNSTLSNEIRDVLKLQAGRDQFPQLVENKIVPVIDVNPKHARKTDIVASVNKATSGTLTAYTAPTDREVYITSITFSFIKDATCDMATGKIPVNVTIKGINTEIFAFASLTTTAQSDTITLYFNNPLLIDKGGSVYNSNTFTAGACNRHIAITGFELLNSNA